MDKLFIALECALRTVFAPTPLLPYPKTVSKKADVSAASPSPQEMRLTIGLMRVNHVGEVCAQALYTGQALTSKNPFLKAYYKKACEEETPHLSWTQQRLAELGGRVSYLNPFWYAGSFALGMVAGCMQDGVSLGFVAETEHQVGRHLQHHLEVMPTADTASRAIVEQMYDDEMHHATDAIQLGGVDLPWAVKKWMQCNAKIMTLIAHHI